MIGVISKPSQVEAVEEFFQLFKTPWEFYRPGEAYEVVVATAGAVSTVNTKLLLIYGPEMKSFDSHFEIALGQRCGSSYVKHRHSLVPIYCGVCPVYARNGSSCVVADTETAGARIEGSDTTVIRLGYDLFEEVKFLLTVGQPSENAASPALDAHIGMLREWILEESIPLMEVLPSPVGYSFSVCLTHDIDFIGIRQHTLDHTMFGFLYRSTVGALIKLLQKRISVGRLLQTWRAVISLPFVYLGWAKDFWEPFEWYLKAERGLPATYFLIPFKRRAGDHVPGPHAARRAAAYDVTDVRDCAIALQNEGCELGVHGVDAWHSTEKGRAELERVAQVARQSSMGIRMHWLLQDSTTTKLLEEAGFAYDSTAGYNETVGYRNGTTQVFRPIGARALLELPINIQDGALFYSQRLDLSESEAEERCQPLIDHAVRQGGVLTLLWHDRSHGPERFWGEFYLRMIRQLQARNVWFGTAGQVVEWFRQRREVRFERIETSEGICGRLRYDGGAVLPPFCVRVYQPVHDRSDGKVSDFVDIAWNGTCSEALAKYLPAQFSSSVASVPLS